MSVVNDVEPRILKRSEHSISRKNISTNTLKVLYRLNKSGHKAYLVGGGVRDLMLGRRPKDFDVSTDARPEQVRGLFRNSRIIGRRFRLAHVYFKGEVVEVATFRREPDPEDQDSGDQELLITSDNTWGTPREDAFRRDFTINALFYNIDDFSVLDYVGGIDDLEDGVIRCIGDPDVRFREDPVRMMRACEFAGRLGFDVERQSQEAIGRLRGELRKASTARLTEEIIQLMKCGHAEDAIDWMLELGLTEALLPEAEAMLDAEEVGLGDLRSLLGAVDELIAERRRDLSDVLLLAALLLPRALVRREAKESRRDRPLPRAAIERLVGETVDQFVSRFTVSKVRSQHMQAALTSFFRLCEPGWAEAERARFARRPSFDDALLLFELMTRATGEGQPALEAWQAARSKSQGREQPRRRPRRRRRRR